MKNMKTKNIYITPSIIIENLGNIEMICGSGDIPVDPNKPAAGDGGEMNTDTKNRNSLTPSFAHEDLGWDY